NPIHHLHHPYQNLKKQTQSFNNHTLSHNPKASFSFAKTFSSTLHFYIIKNPHPPTLYIINQNHTPWFFQIPLTAA
ncbi:hypothetical protein, partial [Bacillus pumilus]|uniref:hypothetical protein n=1 Tax=Bacillus pumilus TaxID=1408 RepID=UPI001C92C88C